MTSLALKLKFIFFIAFVSALLMCRILSDVNLYKYTEGYQSKEEQTPWQIHLYLQNTNTTNSSSSDIDGPSSVIQMAKTCVSGSTCPGVLENMMTGEWRSEHWTSEKEEDVVMFQGRRSENPNLSCQFVHDNSSDVNSPYVWKNCGPDEKDPCCYGNHCAYEKCRCPLCHEPEYKINAEASIWTANDSRCQVKNFTASSACDVIGNGTLHFYGDSIVRQMFLGLVSILNHTSILKPGLNETEIESCREHYLLTRRCRDLINKTPMVCRGQVKLVFAWIRTMEDVPEMLETAKPLMGLNNSVILFGGAAWLNYNTKTTTQFATSLLDMLYKNGSRTMATWPMTVWKGLHATGAWLNNKEKMAFSTDVFNRHMQEVSAKYGVPMFDTVNITKYVTTADGLHYGLGVNNLKAQIFLHYIAQMKRTGVWV